MTAVLGIGYYVAHDSNAACVIDTQPAFACSEERLSRRKKDGRLPMGAFALARHCAGGPATVVCASSTLSDFHESHRGPRYANRVTSSSINLMKASEQALLELGTAAFLGHHHCHAAGAFFCSGFERALVITYDAGIVSEPWLATAWQAEGTTLRPLERFGRIDGAVAALHYSAVTDLLGYRPVHDEGKVTGLAATVRATTDCVEALRDSLAIHQDAEYYWSGRYSRENRAILDKFQPAALANAIQVLTEERVINFVRRFAPQPEQVDCVLAGGLFANVRVNMEIASLGFRRLFVYPAMGDEGLSLGAALAYVAEISGERPRRAVSMLLGPAFSQEAIALALLHAGLSFSRPRNLAGEIAELLASGYVVARFDGRMEYGPRALGNRSILFSAATRRLAAQVNQLLSRDPVMPFAPVSMATQAAHLHKGDLEPIRACCDNMTIAVPCTTAMLDVAPAAVHSDGTARLQVVDAERNSGLCDILDAYQRLTGSPVLINTSFNEHNEPIVCTPSDAIRTFVRCRLDALAIGPYLVRREL